MNLDGLSAIITGGASGLGAATARELTSRGVKVTLWDLNEDLGNEVAKEIGGAFAKVNVSSEDDALAGLEGGGAARAGHRRHTFGALCSRLRGGTVDVDCRSGGPGSRPEQRGAF